MRPSGTRSPQRRARPRRRAPLRPRRRLPDAPKRVEVESTLAALEGDGPLPLRNRALDRALERYQRDGAAEFPAFAEAVQAYAAFHWDHMRTEEDTLIPLARRHLTARDWEEIDAAFTGLADPQQKRAPGFRTIIIALRNC